MIELERILASDFQDETRVPAPQDLPEVGLVRTAQDFAEGYQRYKEHRDLMREVRDGRHAWNPRLEAVMPSGETIEPQKSN